MCLGGGGGGGGGWGGGGGGRESVCACIIVGVHACVGAYTLIPQDNNKAILKSSQSKALVFI